MGVWSAWRWREGSTYSKESGMSNPVRIDPDESPRARFAYELRALRRENGLTQRQLGERIGYAESSIGMVEQGHRPPTQLLAELVDEAFNLPGTFAKLYLKTTWAGAPEHFRSWLLEEQDATALRGYEPTLIPGLFETEAYARAAFSPNRDVRPSKWTRGSRRASNAKPSSLATSRP